MVPSGSTGGVTPQLIQDDQQTSFISPKYSLSSLANANTEDATPGYNVKVFKSTSLNSGSLGRWMMLYHQMIISLIIKQVCYSLNLRNSASNIEVYMTAYQYVGKTLDQGANFSGDAVLNSVSSSLIPANDDKHDIGSTSRNGKIYL